MGSLFRRFSLPLLVSTTLTILPLLTSSVFSIWAVNHEDVMRTWGASGWLILTVVLSFSSALALAPPTLIAVVYGYFLRWQALPYLFGLNLLAIVLVYGSTRLTDPNRLLSRIELAYPGIAPYCERFRTHELRLIFWMKLSPLFPFAVTNLLFALSGARFDRIVLGGVMGMVPRTVLAIWIGMEAKEIRLLMENPNEGIAVRLFLLGLLLISSLGIGFVFRNVIPAKPQD